MIKNKRGFGAAQVFAIAVVVIMGSIFIFSSSFMMNSHEGVDATAVEGLNDFSAQYALMGLLRSPISYDINLPDATVADAITRSNPKNNNFEEDVRHVLDGLLAKDFSVPKGCTGLVKGYHFVIKGKSYFGTDYNIKKYNVEGWDLGSDAFVQCSQKQNATVLLPTSQGSQEVSLMLCRLQSGDARCQ